jgi:hypothetical protein
MISLMYGVCFDVEVMTYRHANGELRDRPQRLLFLERGSSRNCSKVIAEQDSTSISMHPEKIMNVELPDSGADADLPHKRDILHHISLWHERGQV